MRLRSVEHFEICWKKCILEVGFEGFFAGLSRGFFVLGRRFGSRGVNWGYLKFARIIRDLGVHFLCQIFHLLCRKIDKYFGWFILMIVLCFLLFWCFHNPFFLNIFFDKFEKNNFLI